MKQYSFRTGLTKALKYMIIFGLPIVINLFPAWGNLTISGVVVLITNWVKVNLENY